MRYCLILMAVLICTGTLAGCATTGGGSERAQQRKAILNMHDDALRQLYEVKPDVRPQIAHAPGYAVFSTANIHVIFASLGGGRGVARNNRTGEYTYMKMGEAGLGLGLGAKDVRLIFVFHSRDSMRRFVDTGWTFGAQADVAAKASDKGGALGGELQLDNMTVYQLTETGLALQATLKGAKFWKDEDLD